MTREKLLEITDRYIAWFQSRDNSHEALAALVAPEVVIHVPFMGLSPDFAGLLAQHARVGVATNDMRITITHVCVDETNSMVTQAWEISGHHTGEYVGIPASGKPYKIAGLGMVKIDLARGLIVEDWNIIQDLLLFIQLGVVPPPGAPAS